MSGSFISLNTEGCVSSGLFSCIKQIIYEKYTALLQSSLVSFLLLLAEEERWLAIASSFCLACLTALYSPSEGAVKSCGCLKTDIYSTNEAAVELSSHGIKIHTLENTGKYSLVKASL